MKHEHGMLTREKRAFNAGKNEHFGDYLKHHTLHFAIIPLPDVLAIHCRISLDYFLIDIDWKLPTLQII